MPLKKKLQKVPILIGIIFWFLLQILSLDTTWNLILFPTVINFPKVKSIKFPSFPSTIILFLKYLPLLLAPGNRPLPPSLINLYFPTIHLSRFLFLQPLLIPILFLTNPFLKTGWLFLFLTIKFFSLKNIFYLTIGPTFGTSRVLTIKPFTFSSGPNY